MTADPVTGPMNMLPDPIDQLISLEEAFAVPVRAEFIEGMPLLPPLPVPGVDGNGSHYAAKAEVDLGRPLPLPVPYPVLQTAFLLAGG